MSRVFRLVEPDRDPQHAMMLVALRRALTDATTAGDRALQAKRATRLVTHSIDVAVAALQEAIRVVEAKG